MAEDSNKSLFALYAEMDQIVTKIMESEGELDAITELALDENAKDIAVKVDRYKFVMDRMGQLEDYFKGEANRYMEGAKAIAAECERVKTRLSNFLKDRELEEIRGEKYRFKLQNTAPKVLVENEKIVPVRYFVEKTTRSLDKKRLKQALQEGLQIAGARLEPVKSLRSYVNTKVK